VKQIFTLNTPRDKARAAHAVQLAPDGYVVTIAEPTRSLNQNAALHPMLTDIAEQVTWQGQKFSMEVWKRLTMAAFLREDGGNPLLIPALDGKGFDIIYEHTSKLSAKKFADLLSWVECFAAEQGVKFKSNREE
jgi:hypothetical protein